MNSAPASANNSGPNPLPPLRSVNSSVKCKLFFWNKSTRNAQIIWINYNGEEKEYFTLGPERSFIIDSFVTHPWIFRDCLRNHMMLADAYLMKKEHFVASSLGRMAPPRRLAISCRVFYPEEHDDTELLQIIIKNGVYSLRELCFQRMCDLKLSNAILDGVPRTVASEFELYRNCQPLEQAFQA